MNKYDFCNIIQSLIKEIRLENSLSQELMADQIGVSKKTYIQLEKNRSKLGWAETVTICVLFQNAKAIVDYFGEEIIEIVQAIGQQKLQTRQLPTFGGEIWWNNIKVENGFVMQQHKITKHYRILDQENYRLFFTLSKDLVEKRFNRYIGRI